MCGSRRGRMPEVVRLRSTGLVACRISGKRLSTSEGSMRVSPWRLLTGVVLVTVIAGCGSSGSTTQQSSSGAKGTAPAQDQAANTKHTILKSGFGGDNQYVWVAALVR